MMRFKIGISFIITILILLFSPLQKLILPFLIVLLIHESGHLFFILIFKIKIKMISLSAFGAYIDIDNYSLKFYEEIFVFSGGIIFNLLSLFYLNEEYCKLTYLIIIFNIIPCYPLDGARVIKSILCLFLNYKSTMIISYFISLFSLIISFIIVFKEIDGLIIINLCYLLYVIILEIKNIKIIYEAFLLYKYLNKPVLRKKKIRFTHNLIDKLYRFNTIYTKINNEIISEEDILRLHFEGY